MAERTNLTVQCCRCRNKHKESERKWVRASGGMNQSVCPRCGARNWYDITPWYAWCWRSGLIEMGAALPADNPDGSGAILVAHGPRSHLEGVIKVLARHGQGASEGKLLVPGVPEAELMGRDPVDELAGWLSWCASGNGRRGRFGVVFAKSLSAEEPA